jgi:hypothetical protein
MFLYSLVKPLPPKNIYVSLFLKSINRSLYTTCCCSQRHVLIYRIIELDLIPCLEATVLILYSYIYHVICGLIVCYP